MITNNLLGYTINVIENNEDLESIVKDAPKSISLFAFDTETDTKIDMAKPDADNIDIMHDKPFLLQFGYNNIIYVIDFRLDIDKNRCLQIFDELCQRSTLALAHNIKFDINMLANIGYMWHTNNACDSMTIARLSLESITEREGGMSLGLKPLAARLLGSQYAELGKEIDEALKDIWRVKLKSLALSLKPYGITRKTVNDILKDVSSSLDMFSDKVQIIWNDWKLHSRISYADINPDLIHMYGGTDVLLVLELTKLLLPVVKSKNQMSVLKREMRLIMPLVRMERTGYTVDKNYLIKCKQALIFEVNSIKDRNYQIAGSYINPNQHQTIKDMIKNKFGYELKSTDKNQMHIAIRTDTTMPDEVKEYLDNVIYLRTLEKWISTYINPMIYKLNATGDTKVYTTYNPNGAVSGRFTSNFQQFPKNAIYSKIGNFELFHPRKMFIVSKGYPKLAYIDYSQVELRLQAEYTYYCTHGYGDINMLRAYMPFKCYEKDGKYYHNEDNKEWKAIDLHTQSTQMAFPDVPVDSPEFKKLRSIGKRVNFALIYGASLSKVQETLSDTDPEIVAKLYNGFHFRFKDVKVYNQWVTKTWFDNNGYVTNLLGRRYYITDSSNVYKLNNYLIQGSAADIIKSVIIEVDSFLRKHHYKTKLQGCIHDELCICVAEGEDDVLQKIKYIMEHTCKTFVPLVAEISTSTTNWAEKKGD